MRTVTLHPDYVLHPDVVGVSNGAFRLHVGAQAWLARFGRPHITTDDLLVIFRHRPNTRGFVKALRELLAAGLLHKIGEETYTVVVPAPIATDPIDAPTPAAATQE